MSKDDKTEKISDLEAFSNQILGEPTKCTKCNRRENHRSNEGPLGNCRCGSPMEYVDQEDAYETI